MSEHTRSQDLFSAAEYWLSRPEPDDAIARQLLRRFIIVDDPQPESLINAASLLSRRLGDQEAAHQLLLRLVDARPRAAQIIDGAALLARDFDDPAAARTLLALLDDIDGLEAHSIAAAAHILATRCDDAPAAYALIDRLDADGGSSLDASGQPVIDLARLLALRLRDRPRARRLIQDHLNVDLAQPGVLCASARLCAWTLGDSNRAEALMLELRSRGELTAHQIVEGAEVLSVTLHDAAGARELLLRLEECSRVRPIHWSEARKLAAKIDAGGALDRRLQAARLRRGPDAGGRPADPSATVFSPRQQRVGDVRRGRVLRLKDNGFEVSVGKSTGLLPLSAVSRWGDVEWSEALQIISIGEQIEVVVAQADPRTGRLILEANAISTNGIRQTFAVGSGHQGVVRAVQPYGVFLRLAPGVTGLLHRTQLAPGESPEDFAPGGDVEVEVLAIDDERGWLQLSRRTDSAARDNAAGGSEGPTGEGAT